MTILGNINKAIDQSTQSLRNLGASIAALGTRAQRLEAFHSTAYATYTQTAPPWLRYDVLLAQAILETGGFSSRLFVAANNAFGMLFNSRGFATGTFSAGNYNYARYSSVSGSVADYIGRMVAANAGRFTGGRQPFDATETLDQYLRVLNDPSRPAGNYAEAKGYNDAIRAIIANEVGPFLKAKGIPPSRLQTVSGTPLGGTFPTPGQAEVLDSIESRGTFDWGRFLLNAALVLTVVGGIIFGARYLIARNKPRKPLNTSKNGKRNRKSTGKAGPNSGQRRKSRKAATK